MKRNIFTGIAILALAALVGACTPTTPATGASTSPQQAGAPQNVITVTGSGQAVGSPDIATIELGVEARDADVSAALERTNTTIDAVTAALVELGIEENDIQTANFSVWQEENRDPETGSLDGDPTFRVQNTIRVKVRDTSLISDVIDAGLSNGANQVYGLNFSLDDPTTLREQAREAAITDAREQAEALADLLGVSVGQVVAVSEGGGGGGIPRPAVEAADEGRGGGPSINQGQLSVNVSVTVSYAIEY